MLRDFLNRSDSTDELSHGQVVIVAARWILVLAGIFLALWNPAAMGELRIQIVLILALAVGNFYLHAQVLQRRPVLAPVVYASSAADIAVISLIIIAGGGFESGLYVFYFPAILAFSVAFRMEVSFAFTGAAVAAYGLISFATLGEGDGVTIITRLLMLAAVAVCGHLYWRIEGDRRLDVEKTHKATSAQVRGDVQTN